MKPEKDDTEFQHPYFIRGQEHLLENIKRKVTSVSFRNASFGKGFDKLFENKALVGTASGCSGGSFRALQTSLSLESVQILPYFPFFFYGQVASAWVWLGRGRFAVSPGGMEEQLQLSGRGRLIAS